VVVQSVKIGKQPKGVTLKKEKVRAGWTAKTAAAAQAVAAKAKEGNRAPEPHAGDASESTQLFLKLLEQAQNRDER